MNVCVVVCVFNANSVPKFTKKNHVKITMFI